MQTVFSALYIIGILLSPSTNCQTDFSISSKVVNNSYSVYLSLKEGSQENYAFQLHDLNSGDLVAKADVMIESKEPILVFRNVKPSSYAIYFTSVSCNKKKSIKGLGLLLE